MKNETSPKTIQRGWLLLFLAWIIATSGTLTSLFFSEVIQLPVCSLCWYQRICMYPLVLIFPLALFPYDQKVVLC
ncbi:MAG: disulfide bond formation protein B [Gammaproteobacteria bacterium]|nr:disulfide bond formation protein B [Gammaproteobacteria bacterium]